MSFARRWWFRIFVGLLVTTSIGLVHVFWNRHKAHEELRQVLADLDAAEPDWRLEQIEANRRVVPDKENGARVVNAAFALLPKNWQFQLEMYFEETPPQFRFHPDSGARFRDELQFVANAVEESRKIRNYPNGRFAITYSPDFMSTNVSEQQNARAVVQLLFLDAHQALELEQPERAVDAIQAILNIGRYFEDEPLLISTLIRIALQSMAISALERTLAQGEVSEDVLAQMQNVLQEEASSKPFLVGVRGERAGMQVLFDYLASGKIPVTTALTSFGGRTSQPTWWDRVIDIRARTMVYKSNAWLIPHQTRLVNAAKLSGSARYIAIRDIEFDFRDFASTTSDYDLILAKLMAAAVAKVAEAEQRILTKLDCTMTAVAAERFRIKHARWPTKLDELVEHKMLAAVPEDLYDGQPLRLRRAADGIVIYSIGKDGAYRGDMLDDASQFDPTQTRWEFRLWDPQHRRQPPLPARRQFDGGGDGFDDPPGGRRPPMPPNTTAQKSAGLQLP